MRVIIIGAGAAGLMAANHLSAHGVEVTVFEARERIGGRIYTLPVEMFSVAAEGGAEFVHGHLKVTTSVASLASVSLKEMQGSFWKVEKNRWNQDDVFLENEELLIKELEHLEQDESIASFLQNKFGDKQFVSMRESILNYVMGYDAADTNKASAFAFRDEWKNEEDAQFRLDGGYIKILEYLYNKSVTQGSIIRLNSVVTEVKWENQKVTVHLKNQEPQTSNKVIFTIPLGVWQSAPYHSGYIQVHPPIPAKTEAYNKMGYGAVIKIILKFTQPFWKSRVVHARIGQNIHDLSFLISDTIFPTWWTLHPLDVSIISGWMAGPSAEQRKQYQETQLLEEAIISLGAIFQMDPSELYKLLERHLVINWTADPFAAGGYSYSTVHSKEAQKVAGETIEETLYYAGEAFYKGSEMGTVEAALASGLQTAKELLKTII